jgi:hypothetical protein
MSCSVTWKTVPVAESVLAYAEWFYVNFKTAAV